MPTISFRVPDTLVDSLNQLVEATGRDRSTLVREALHVYVQQESWQVAEIQNALREADAGDFASGKQLQKIDKKWGYAR